MLLRGISVIRDIALINSDSQRFVPWDGQPPHLSSSPGRDDWWPAADDQTWMLQTQEQPNWHDDWTDDFDDTNEWFDNNHSPPMQPSTPTQVPASVRRHADQQNQDWTDDRPNDTRQNSLTESPLNNTLDSPQLTAVPLPDSLGVDGQSHVITPPENSFVIASPFASFEDSQAFLAQQGLEVLAIMGTGPTGEAPPHLEQSPFALDGKVQAGYHYLNAGRLTGNTDSPVVKNDTLLQQDFSALSGTLTRTDGKTVRLDMSDLASLDPKARIKARNARLAKLEQDPQTVAIALDAWPAGQVSGEGRDTVPNSRSFRVFDPQGQFLGHVTTPALSLDEAETVARQIYGDRFGSMDNLDGNVYAKAWVANAGDQPGSTELAKELKFGVLLVRPTQNIEPVKTDSTQARQDRKKALDKEQRQDRLRRLWEYTKRGEVGVIWDKIRGKG